MSPTLTCPACGARWHTAARRGRAEATDTCLRCGGALSEELGPVGLIEALVRRARTGNIEAALELCHGKIEIFELPELFPGEDESFKGHEGARRWMERVFAIWDIEFTPHRRETRVVDDQTVELVNELHARSSHGHPDFSATTRSLWSFEAGLLRRVEFSVVGAAAPDANPA